MPLNVVRLSGYLNGLFQHAWAVLALLVALLALLLFLTSLLSASSVLSDTFVDIAIYAVYLLFVLLLGSAVFLLYALFDSDTSLFSRSETQRADRLETEAVARYKAGNMRSQDPSCPADGKRVSSALFNEAKQVGHFAADERMAGFALAASHDEKQMAAYLTQQHPQVAAVTLMMCDSKKSAAILDQMEGEEGETIRRRIAKTETVSEVALKRLDLALQKEFMPLYREWLVLSHLASSDIREILRHVDKRELMYVLKGAAQELQERFFANMSSKASVEFITIMASSPMPDKIQRQNAVRSVYLLAEQLRVNDKIRVNNTGQR